LQSGTEIAAANELHKKYGPVVRESPGDVFFVSEQAYKGAKTVIKSSDIY